MSFTKTRLALRSLVFTVSKDAYTPCFHALCDFMMLFSSWHSLIALSFSSRIRKEAKQSVSLATFLLPSLTLSCLWTGVFLWSKTMKSLSSGQLGHNWLFQSRTLQNTKLWRLAYFQSSFLALGFSQYFLLLYMVLNLAWNCDTQGVVCRLVGGCFKFSCNIYFDSFW